MNTKVVVKKKDEWSTLAEFIGNIIAKYADQIDFDSLPDPEEYLMYRELFDKYKAYIRAREKLREKHDPFHIELVFVK